MGTFPATVSVFYKLTKADTSTEDELHRVQSGITRVQKNAAQADSERKRCPTAALDSLSQTLYVTSLFLLLTEPLPPLSLRFEHVCVSVLAATEEKKRGQTETQILLHR